MWNKKGIKRIIQSITGANSKPKWKEESVEYLEDEVKQSPRSRIKIQRNRGERMRKSEHQYRGLIS